MLDRYKAAKSALLEAGAARQIDPESLDGLLDDLRSARRVADRLAKAAETIAAQRPREPWREGTAAMSAGETVARPDGSSETAA